MYFGRPNPNRPCWNGPQCRFLAQSRCTFYHPPEHRGITRTSLSQMLSLQRMRQLIRNRQRQQERQRQRAQQRLSQRASHLEQMRIRARQRYENQQHQQFSNLLLLRSFQQRFEQTNSANLPKVKEFQWFFQKNSHFKINQLSKQSLEKCDQCSICCEQFNQIVDKKNQQVQKAQQKRIQLSSIDKKESLFELFYRLKIEQQKNEQIKIAKQKQDQQELIVIQLFCKHLFHKKCVQKWLKQKPHCPLCKRDFRDHQNYKQWDVDYKKRIEVKRQSLFDFHRQIQIIGMPRESQRRENNLQRIRNSQRIISSDWFQGLGSDEEQSDNYYQQEQIFGQDNQEDYLQF